MPPRVTRRKRKRKHVPAGRVEGSSAQPVITEAVMYQTEPYPGGSRQEGADWHALSWERVQNFHRIFNSQLPSPGREGVLYKVIQGKSCLRKENVKFPKSLPHAVPLNRCTHGSGGKGSPEKETEAQRQMLANGRVDTQTMKMKPKFRLSSTPFLPYTVCHVCLSYNLR